MHAASSFDYALIRVVPRVEREEFLNAGVVLFCLTQDFLGAQVALDVARLRAFSPGIDLEGDLEAVLQHLASIPLLCAGDPRAGSVARLSRKERFHWLVSPRSTVVQMSPVHSGICTDPALALEQLVAKMVRLLG